MPKRQSPSLRLVVPFLLLALAIGAFDAALWAAAAQPRLRYLGKWVDGTLLSGDTVAPWHDTPSSPQLAGRPLLDPNRHVRWLLDDTLLMEAPPASWVEFVGGDFLPGRVVGAATGNESPALRVPPHLELSSHVPVDWPDGPSRPRIRISTAWVRRIVWQSTARQCQPQTLFYRDGRQLGFRSVRFSPTAIQLLREEGIQEVLFEEAAELHMPQLDAWEGYFDQLAALSPDGASRIVQVETTGGMRVTGSTDRFQAKSRGAPQDNPNNWHHLVQPVWSLDAFWVPHRTIRLRRYCLPHEAPLSGIDPSASRQESDLGGPWPYRVDRNVQGGPLAGGGQVYPWGFGVHANCELEFSVPAPARAFQTRLGLDQIAGEGGCVRAKVLWGASRKSLYQSPLLIGSSDVPDSGRLSLDWQGQPSQRLILQVEAVRQGRPAGADPFGIRANFDWLEPLVELDAEKVKEEIFRRSARWIPAWQEWKVTSNNREGARLVNHWDQTDSRSPGYRLLATSGATPLTLSAKLRVRPDRDLLLLAVSRPPQSTPSKIEVRIDGKPLGAEAKPAGAAHKPSGPFEVPVRHSPKAPEPLTISLEDYQDRQVQVELVQLSQDEKSLVQWDAISLVAPPAKGDR